jgi:hypothetical protein
MMIDGNLGPFDHLGWGRAERPAGKDRAGTRTDRADPTPAPDVAAGGSAAESSNVHQVESLRAAADRLLEQGDIDARQDSLVRPSRAELVKQKYEDGTYDRREVLDRIVDRLIEQWQI